MTLNWNVDVVDEIRELRLEDMHPVLGDRISVALGSEFENVGALKWVKRGLGPFRAILLWQKAPLQGLMPRWGWSIDFVPHVGAKRIGWHKSMRSARLDCGNWNNITPSDFRGLSYISNMRDFVKRGEKSDQIENAVDKAQEFWATYFGIDGVLQFTTEFRKRGWLLPLINHPLPEVFCLGQVGQISLARKILNEESFELLRFHKPVYRERILNDLQNAVQEQWTAMNVVE